MRKTIAALLVASVLVTVFAVGVNAQTFYQRFENVWAKTLTTTGTATIGGNATVGGTLATTGASTAASYAATGALTAGTFINATRATTLTITDGGTITPTGTWQPLTAAGAVGASLAVGSEKRLVILTNVGAQTITISDTTGALLSGNIALGAGDSLTVLSDGTQWVQLATSNN